MITKVFAFSIVQIKTDFKFSLFVGGIFPLLPAYSSTKKFSLSANWAKPRTWIKECHKQHFIMPLPHNLTFSCTIATNGNIKIASFFMHNNVFIIKISATSVLPPLVGREYIKFCPFCTESNVKHLCCQSKRHNTNQS